MFDFSLVAFAIKTIPGAEIGRRLTGTESTLLVAGRFHVPNAPGAKVIRQSRPT